MGDTHLKTMADEMESQGVSPKDLSLEQLSQVKKQLDQEIQMLTNNVDTFKTVISKCEESKDAVEAIVPENSGKSMLVPLTGSLYCPGKLGSCQKVLIDIGTGYYIRTNRAKAQAFFDRKLELVKRNIEGI